MLDEASLDLKERRKGYTKEIKFLCSYTSKISGRGRPAQGLATATV